MNQHNERAELLKAIRNQLGDDFDPSDCFYEQGLLYRAAAMLEAQPAEQANGAVAYVRFRNGKVDYDADDGIVIMNTPGDCMDESIEWRPVYTTPPAQPAEQAKGLEAAAWHHPECEGSCIACLIEQSVVKDYGKQGLAYLQKHVGTTPPSQPARECDSNDIPAILKKQAS